MDLSKALDGGNSNSPGWPDQGQSQPSWPGGPNPNSSWPSSGGPNIGGWPPSGGPNIGGWPSSGGPNIGGWPSSGGPNIGGWPQSGGPNIGGWPQSGDGSRGGGGGGGSWPQSGDGSRGGGGGGGSWPPSGDGSRGGGGGGGSWPPSGDGSRGSGGSGGGGGSWPQSGDGGPQPVGPVVQPSKPLDVPNSHPFPGGFHDKLLITIRGTVKRNPNKFAVDLHTAHDLAFHFNPRFNENGRKVIVRNSCIGGKWGQEERQLGHFPFAPEKTFEMKILCTHSEFRVAVDNSHLLEFKHRITNLRSITRLCIHDDINLHEFKVENLP